MISGRFFIVFHVFFVTRGLRDELHREKLRPIENTVFYESKCMSELSPARRKSIKNRFSSGQNGVLAKTVSSKPHSKRSLPPFGLNLVPLGRPRAQLGASWAPLGASWAPLGLNLEALGRHLS